MKDGFLAQWLALPPRENHQVQEKIRLLIENPLPDAKTKKQLKHIDARLHRIRSGDYRIFYTFEKPYVSLLALSRRDEGTYGDAPTAQDLGGLESDLQAQVPSVRVAAVQPKWEKKAAGKPLPAPLDDELLSRLQVPTQFHANLRLATNEDELLACTEVPDDVLLRVHQALFERPFDEVFQQKEFVAQEVDDLLRYKEGELLGFLLRLTPEQDKFVEWALNAAGPTLVKGGPGTGKSTVALYRVRAMIQALRAAGVQTPRILFTTYTNALVAFSRQLLDGLLGGHAHLVDVRTADSLAREIVESAGQLRAFAQPQDLRVLLQQAVSGAHHEGNSLEQRAQAQTLARLGADYLLEEICSVIDARGLSSLEGYLAAARPGRKVPLGATQRRAVWAVRDELHRLLDRSATMTWQQLRAAAAAAVRAGKGPASYDAVVVDEVQDLNPATVQMLVELAGSPGQVFLTADANQSIFGSGFRWQDVHEALRFRGRTGILRINHRSTQEIGEAARSYLAEGLLEADDAAPGYSHSGPLPAVRDVASPGAEADLLARFVRGATRGLHLGIGAAAVFVPSEKTGKTLAADLSSRGVSAVFMGGRDLDLQAPSVKVMTLKSAKGLEFPVVAVAGFGIGSYPLLPPHASPEERAERLSQERRTLYVAMTRAMRALLVVRPKDGEQPLLDSFSPVLWNIKDSDR